MREPDLRLTAADAGATRAIGVQLADALQGAALLGPFIIGLSGELGAGKTTLVGGLLEALGHEGPVRSPTYSLIEPYRLAGRDIYHCDLYRLRDPEELEDLGLRDLLAGPSVLVVEWPERAGDRLPEPDLRLELDYLDSGRQVSAAATTGAGQRVIDRLRLDTA